MQNIKKIAHDYNLIKSKSYQILEFTCRVKQLSEYEPSFEIKFSRDCSGQWLLDEVCDRFGPIQEKDYFGLRYEDKDKQRQWLDLGKSIYSQLKDTHPMAVSFRVKHYPASPVDDLKQDLACTCLYLQLRRDLYSGRLLGKTSDLYQLAAYAVQYEFGDYDFQNEDSTYISELKLLPNLHVKTEAKIVEIHKTLVGLSKQDAERKLLEKACEFDTYGIEPFYVKDQKGNNLYVGLTHDGVSTFQGSRRAHLFKWSDILKIHYQGKLFIIQVVLDEKKHILGFKCETSFAAAALWKWANDRMYFFSLNRASDAVKVKSGGGVFKKRRTFRFSGRCQNEIRQLSASMMQINDHGSMGSRANSTLQRCNAVQDDFYIDDSHKYDTLPSRDRGGLDTLDSLFSIKAQGSGDNDTDQSSSLPSLGSPKGDKKSINQSLEHIIEEPHLSAQEHIISSNFGLTYADPKIHTSENSSTKSSAQNLSLNPDLNTNQKLSSANGDIAGALAQLDGAVIDAKKKEITKVVKRHRIGHYLLKLVYLSFVLMAALLLATLFAVLFTAFTVKHGNQKDSYDYSNVFYELVSRPGDFLPTNHVPEIARNCYIKVSNYLSRRSNEP